MKYTSSSTIGCYRNSTDMAVGYHPHNTSCCSFRQFGVSPSEANTTIFVLSAQQEARNSISSPKKKVRFADDEGGLLCSVKIFEENPFVYQPRFHTPVNTFTNKSKLSNYTVVYNETKLLLKQVCVVAYGLLGDSTLFGAIAVRNVSFEKKISVRLTLDSWKTSCDITAKFVQQEYNGRIDRFFFTKKIDEGSFDTLSPNIEFAVCYTTSKGQEHWDNNGGDNYKFTPPSQF